MRLFFGRDRRQLDHQVRLLHHLAQHVGGVVFQRHETLVDLAAGEQHLVGGLASAALAAHAVGHDAHHRTGGSLVRDDLDLVLLVGAIALVQASGGRESERRDGDGHAREYKLRLPAAAVQQWTRTCIHRSED